MPMPWDGSRDSERPRARRQLRNILVARRLTTNSQVGRQRAKPPPSFSAVSYEGGVKPLHRLSAGSDSVAP